MANVRQKAPELLKNGRGGRGRGVMVPERPNGWRVPALPSEVTAQILDPVQARFQPAAVAHTRTVWRDWWKSAPSHAVDMQSDREAIHWWIICVFRRALYIHIVREQPLVKGSTGQPTPNPLERVIRNLTADINRATDRFGMDTLSRFRLHFEAQGERRGEAPAISWDTSPVEGDDPLAALT